MGLPNITIHFVEKAREVSKRAERGIVGMIVKEASVPETNPITVYKEKDIPGTLSAANKEQVKLALLGNVNAPLRVVVYVLASAAEDYAAALSYFSTHKVTYLCAPTAETDGQASAVADWVKEQRAARNKIKAVLPNTEADTEGVINYTTGTVTVATGSTGLLKVGDAEVGDTLTADSEMKYLTEGLCSRVAGLLAGTPIEQASTFSVLSEAVDSSDVDRASIEKRIDQGEFIIFNDGEKVKVARGVNSLTTVPDGKSDAWKKIKVVEAMDMIYDDLVKLVEDYYIGKYPNTYDNKCLVLSAIMDYFNELVLEGVLSTASVAIDTETVKDYLEEQGEHPETMTEEELKKADTADKLFLTAEISILDAIEEVTLNIAV